MRNVLCGGNVELAMKCEVIGIDILNPVGEDILEGKRLDGDGNSTWCGVAESKEHHLRGKRVRSISTAFCWDFDPSQKLSWFVSACALISVVDKL